MSNGCRNLMFTFLACILVAGCSQNNQPPTLSPYAPVATHPAETATTPTEAKQVAEVPTIENSRVPTEVPSPVYSADDSVCRWSLSGCWGCGGGGGVNFIPLGGTASDAIVSELVGRSPAFSPDGKLVATVDGERVRVWRATDGQPEYIFAGDAFVFSPDGHTIAIRETEGWYLWDIITREHQHRLADRDVSLYFSANGRTIVTEDITEENQDGNVRLYDAKAASELLELQDILLPTAISPDGELFAAVKRQDAGATDIEVIVIWDISKGAELHVLQADIQSRLPLAGMRGHFSIDSITFGLNGRTLLSAGPDAVRLWDTASGQHLRCFQTPDHSGAAEAFWDADAATIIGTATGPPFEQEVYLWDANTNHATGMLWLGGGGDWLEERVGVSISTKSGSLLAWFGWNSADMRDRKAYLWDLNSRQLLGVLPTSGDLTNAVISPAGDRVVTVSTYSSRFTRQMDYRLIGSETLLWDTSHAGVALAAVAQESYWNALRAAVNGEPLEAQLRFLHMAQSQSPESYDGVVQFGVDEKVSYAKYLDRLGLLEAIAGDSEQAAEDFYAELRTVKPKWLDWTNQDLIGQVSATIINWGAGRTAGLVAAYHEFAELDPNTARTPVVIAALLDRLSYDATLLAKKGDIAGATVMFREALSPYLGLDIQPETAAQLAYALRFVSEASDMADHGDIADAVTKYEEALAIAPSLLIEPEVEAKREYAQALLREGLRAMWEGNFTGAVTKYEEALALDPSLPIEPEVEAKRENVQALLREGYDAVWEGNFTGAVTKYEEALALDPSLPIEPETEAVSIYETLVANASYMAGRGNIAGAVAKFKEALAIDPSILPSIPIEPEIAAKLGYAQTLVDEASDMADHGDIAGAVAKFEEALTYDPSLPIEPETAAKRSYAQTLVDEASDMADRGNIAGAVTKFEEALIFDPRLSIEPETAAKLRYAQALVDEASYMANEGDVAGAVAKFGEVLALDPSRRTSLPEYVQVFCALGPDTTALENADALCMEIGVEEAPIVLGETVAATLSSGIIDFWSFDAATAMSMTVDVTVDNNWLDIHLYLIGPDGSTRREHVDYSGSGSHLEVALPQAGRYLIGATAYAGTSGAYRLTLSVAESQGITP